MLSEFLIKSSPWSAKAKKRKIWYNNAMLIFDVLYILALLVAVPVWVKVLFKKEYRKILKKRLSPSIVYSEKKRIWIHAVSVGEVQSIKSLIDQLKRTYPETEIVLTVTTPTGFNITQELYTDIRVINAPVDLSFTVKKFIKLINPKLLILNELEIWPNWVLVTARKKIPIMLINGRMSDHAYGRYRVWMFFLKIFFNKIGRFLVQAEFYRERFVGLGIPEEKIKVCGNIKADQAFKNRDRLPPDREILDFMHLTHHVAGKTVVIIASSHRDDEELIAPVIKGAGDRFFFVLVPRHLARTKDIQAMLAKQGVRFFTWSTRNSSTAEAEGSPGTPQVMIFDKMGYLFNALQVSHIVYMGGTLDPRIGGHNLYEPAVMGKTIIGGPHFNNFPDIGSELVDRGVYRVIHDGRQCLQALQEWQADTGAAMAETAIAAVTARKGSVQCILEEIKPLMDRDPA